MGALVDSLPGYDQWKTRTPPEYDEPEPEEPEEDPDHE